MALVGRLRYAEHRSIPEIYRELSGRGIVLAERTVTNLLDRYDELGGGNPVSGGKSGVGSYFGARMMNRHRISVRRSITKATATLRRRHHLPVGCASDPQLRQHLCQDLTTEGIVQS